MLDWFNAFYQFLTHLPASALDILLLGFFSLLFLVAVYKPAGARIVAFLAALLALVRSKHPKQRRPRRHPSLPPAPSQPTPPLAPGERQPSSGQPTP